MRGGGGRGGGGRGGPGGGMQPGQGRFNISLFHTWRIQDEILIAPGLPVLDLLNGDATDAGGGSPRHQIQAQGGVFKDGMGVFVNATWRQGTEVNGGTGPDLIFDDRTTVGINAFMGAREGLVARWPWLEDRASTCASRTCSIPTPRWSPATEPRPSTTSPTSSTPKAARSASPSERSCSDPEGKAVRSSRRPSPSL